MDAPEELQSLWDYDAPRGSEQRFRALLDGDLSTALRVEVLAGERA